MDSCVLLKRMLFLALILLAMPLVLGVNETPIIFIGGTTNVINDTFTASFNYAFPDYPYVQANTTNRMDFKYEFNGSAITDATINFTISNATLGLAYSPVYGAYSVWLYFNYSEVGDFNWSATANRTGYSNSNLTGTLIVRDYSLVKVKLWQDCTWYQFWCGWFNQDNQQNYKDRFGYILATPIGEDRASRYNWSVKNQLQPLKDFGIWGSRIMGNITNIYRIENQNWNAKYEGGEATLFLPANQTYALSYLAATMAFDQPNGYGYSYYGKTYSENLFLDAVKIMPGLNYGLEYKVTNYELHKARVWLFWIIFGIIAMLLIVIAAFIIRFAPAVGLTVLIGIIILLPAIYLMMKIIFWFIP